MINTVYRLIAPGMIDVACTEPDIKNKVILRPLYLSICKADQRYYLGNYNATHNCDFKRFFNICS